MDFREYESYIIPMKIFLKEYVGIDIQLDLLKKATHKDVKYLNFNNVKAVPFELINKENIYTGDIILVTDGKHHIAPYLNPNRIKEKDKVKNKLKERKIIYDKY